MTAPLVRYQQAVLEHPRGSGEPLSDYLRRIAALVEGGQVAEPLQPMPGERVPGEDDV